jgi:hypothetical protein
MFSAMVSLRVVARTSTMLPFFPHEAYLSIYPTPRLSPPIGHLKQSESSCQEADYLGGDESSVIHPNYVDLHLVISVKL